MTSKSNPVLQADQGGGDNIIRYHVNPAVRVDTDSKIRGGYLPANPLAAIFGNDAYPLVGVGNPYVAGQWTVTATGTSAAVSQDDKGPGIKCVTGSTLTFYAGLQSVMGLNPVSGKRYTFAAIVEVDDVTKLGFNIGFGVSQADPSTTDYTSFVGFKKAKNSATVNSSCRGNTGTAVVGTVTATAANNTRLALECSFVLGAAGVASGQWVINGGAVVPFTSAELTQLTAILTENPSTFKATGFFIGTTGATQTGRLHKFIPFVGA